MKIQILQSQPVAALFTPFFCLFTIAISPSVVWAAAPPPPANLTASAPTAATVTLSWTASAGATSYKIYHSTTPGGEPGTTPKSNITGTSYKLAGLTGNTQYYFTVVAVGGATSAMSNEATAATTKPFAPKNLTVTATGATTAQLAWTNSAGAASYDIYLGTAPGHESGKAYASGAVGSAYTVTGLTTGTTYYFKVAAVANGIAGLKSTETSATIVELTVLYPFSTYDPQAGSGLSSGLIQASDGNFYGTSGGGAYSFGTVFKLTPAGAETVLYSFMGRTDGSGSRGGLIQATNGALYGTSPGAPGCGGNVYEMTLAGVETTLYTFKGGYSDLGFPQGGVIQASDGNFYGTAYCGEPFDFGGVYKLTPAGVETVLHAFTGGSDGEYPEGPLIQASDGNFYGTTSAGGTSFAGTVFKLTPAGVETVLYTFAGGSDGKAPVGGLIQASDGNFYGTTAVGGAYGNGTVYKLTPAGVETVLHSFNGPDGANPQAGVIQASDGNFYGTTNDGGTTGGGTVFRLTPEGVETAIYSFTDGAYGLYLDFGVIQASDGNFYGTAKMAGPENGGVAFKLVALPTP